MSPVPQAQLDLTATPESQHCPHCGTKLAHDTTRRAARCEACRLVVGPGRAVTAQAAGSAFGTRAGLRASASRRTDAAPVPEQLVIDAILQIANELGRPARRLRMTDYADQADTRPAQLPSLDAIIATYGSWKTARAAAADHAWAS